MMYPPQLPWFASVLRVRMLQKKQLKNRELPMSDRLDRMEQKIDKIIEQISSINTTVAVMSVDVQRHVKRSDRLEEMFDVLEQHTDRTFICISEKMQELHASDAMIASQWAWCLRIGKWSLVGILLCALAAAIAMGNTQIVDFLRILLRL
jgi:hypothetical protein